MKPLTGFTRESNRGRSNRGSPRIPGRSHEPWASRSATGRIASQRHAHDFTLRDPRPRPAAWACGPGGRSAGAVRASGVKPQPAPPAPAATPGTAKTPAAAVPEAIDRQPYRIALHLALDPSARIDEARRPALLKQWLALVHRFVGPPWIVTIASPPSPLASGNLEALEASSFATFDPSFDKIWLVRISDGGSSGGLVFTGREYDTATRWLGPLQEHKAVRAGRCAPGPAPVRPGALQSHRADHRPGGREEPCSWSVARRSLRPARWATWSPKDRSSFRSASFPRSTTRSSSGGSSTPTFRWRRCRARWPAAGSSPPSRSAHPARPSTEHAGGDRDQAGHEPDPVPVPHVRPDKSPAAGYTLIARSVPDGVPHELGMTDRAGRIVLKPGFARSLVILRLVAANVGTDGRVPCHAG